MEFLILLVIFGLFGFGFGYRPLSDRECDYLADKLRPKKEGITGPPEGYEPARRADLPQSNHVFRHRFPDIPPSVE
jgi:hypothetical protein